MKTGLSRPGAMMMLVSLVLMFVGGLVPVLLAGARPEHEWFMVLTGFPAVLAALAGTALVVLYFVGFLRYCASKGYSMWLGFWLFLGHVAGFIALLILPDLHATAPQQAPQAKSLQSA